MPHGIKEWIRMKDLKPCYLYRIAARNADYGIWKPKNKSFVIRRTKFNFVYSFEEYHWDTGPPYGTVKPIRELFITPFTEEDIDFYDGKVHLKKEEEIKEYLKGFEMFEAWIDGMLGYKIKNG